MAVATFKQDGTKGTSPATLDKTVFDVAPASHELVKQAYQMYLANGRTNNAGTKTRGLVSGGGKKPWKQKGTGRARFGSSRNPIWRGGGIVFGPTGEENYSKQMNVKAKRLAIRQALSLAVASDKIIVIEALSFTNGKTSEAAALLAKLGVTGTALVVTDNLTEELMRATNNLSSVKAVQAQYLNVFDILNADSIIITNAALNVISNWLGGKE